MWTATLSRPVSGVWEMKDTLQLLMFLNSCRCWSSEKSVLHYETLMDNRADFSVSNNSQKTLSPRRIGRWELLFTMRETPRGGRQSGHEAVNSKAGRTLSFRLFCFRFQFFSLQACLPIGHLSLKCTPAGRVTQKFASTAMRESLERNSGYWEHRATANETEHFAILPTAICRQTFITISRASFCQS